MSEELKQAAQAALEQLEFLNACYPHKTATDASDALRRALTQRPAAQTEREAFEAWARPNGYDLRRNDVLGHYSSIDTSRAWDGFRAGRASLPAPQQATPEPLTLGPLAKRNIYDAIRGAYDLGYNDARNARTVPGDSAPGYDGRSVEEDHGGALFNLLSKRLTPATPEPVGWTDADADAARLAMELECLLLDTKDTAAVSRWWKSANEALDLHRARLAAAQAKGAGHE